MSDIQAEPRYVGYPRAGNPSKYGNTLRLEALGRFYRNFVGVFTPLFALTFLLAIARPIAESRLGLGSSLLLYFILYDATLLLLYMTTYRGTVALAEGLGKRPKSARRIVGALYALTVVASSAVITLTQNGETGFLAATCVPLMAALMCFSRATREFKRYGVRVTGWNVRKFETQSVRALERLRQWEESPFPPIPENMLSGLPPTG